MHIYTDKKTHNYWRSITIAVQFNSLWPSSFTWSAKLLLIPWFFHSCFFYVHACLVRPFLQQLWTFNSIKFRLRVKCHGNNEQILGSKYRKRCVIAFIIHLKLEFFACSLNRLLFLLLCPHEDCEFLHLNYISSSS